MVEEKKSYLGDIIDSKGKNSDNIESRGKKGHRKVKVGGKINSRAWQ